MCSVYIRCMFVLVKNKNFTCWLHVQSISSIQFLLRSVHSVFTVMLYS